MSSPEEEFRSLMTRVGSGCPDAARELFDRYGDHVRRIVRRKLHQGLRSQYDSIDFTQDVWASFFTSPLEKCAFDTPESLVAFLSEMAFHKVSKAFRRGFQTKKYNLNGKQSLNADGPDGEPAPEPPLHGPTPSQVAIANEQWERMNDGQPDRFRLMLELLRQGYNYQEVAERTGLHPKAIQRWLYKMAEGENFR